MVQNVRGLPETWSSKNVAEMQGFYVAHHCEYLGKRVWTGPIASRMKNKCHPRNLTADAGQERVQLIAVYAAQEAIETIFFVSVVGVC